MIYVAKSTKSKLWY